MNAPPLLTPLAPSQGVGYARPMNRTQAPPAPGVFAGVLREVQARDDLRLSAHAQLRLEERGIQLNPETMDALRGAIDKLAAKGARDAVVVSGEAAFVVNVPNRTLVTVLSAAEAEERVFTNIDSLVVLPRRAAGETSTNEPVPHSGSSGAAERSTRRHLMEV